MMAKCINIRILMLLFHALTNANTSYVYNSSVMSYRDAQVECRNGCGELVSLETAQENEEFYIFMQSVNIADQSKVWSGLTYNISLEEFQWPDYSTVYYTNWMGNQPYGHEPDSKLQVCGRAYRDQHYRLSTTFCSKALDFACQSVSGPRNYTIVENHVTQEEARQHCSELGKILIKLKTMDDVDAFDEIMSTVPGINEIWIGLTYDVIMKKIMWLDDDNEQEAIFDYWAQGEPDGIPGNPPDLILPRVCGIMGISTTVGWGVAECSKTYSFVCEYNDGPCSIKTTATSATPTPYLVAVTTALGSENQAGATDISIPTANAMELTPVNIPTSTEAAHWLSNTSFVTGDTSATEQSTSTDASLSFIDANITESATPVNQTLPPPVNLATSTEVTQLLFNTSDEIGDTSATENYTKVTQPSYPAEMPTTTEETPTHTMLVQNATTMTGIRGDSTDPGQILTTNHVAGPEQSPIITEHSSRSPLNGITATTPMTQTRTSTVTEDMKKPLVIEIPVIRYENPSGTVDDNRQSSAAMGTTIMVVLIIVVVILVYSDISKFKEDFRMLKRNVETLCKK